MNSREMLSDLHPTLRIEHGPAGQGLSAKLVLSSPTISSHSCSGSSWPMPSISTRRAPRMASDCPPAEGPHQLVGAAVDHHRRRGDLPVVAQQAAAAEDGRNGGRCRRGSRRGRSPRSPRRGSALRSRVAGLPMILLTRIAFSMIASRDESFGRARIAVSCFAGGGSIGCCCWRRSPPASWCAMAVPGGEDLRDHPAHRRADDVRLVDFEVVEQRCGVVGHILQRVNRRTAQAEKRPDHPGVAGRPCGGRSPSWTARRRGCRSG